MCSKTSSRAALVIPSEARDLNARLLRFARNDGWFARNDDGDYTVVKIQVKRYTMLGKLYEESVYI
ncbi:MAG: hypothetical protein A3F16_06560 [Deltaproteobacteria bacterium RIFCSPHIGHO2_12_FULL_43_9]|nr:MAG: hypothetical protein A3F16_06560 [Deltaproteobacteria bacterium RIFCSPHIGHO2_12_FULL_43_9]